MKADKHATTSSPTTQNQPSANIRDIGLSDNAAERAAQHASKPLAKAPATVALADALYEILELIRRAQAEERRMSVKMIEAIQASGLDRLQGAQAVAVLSQRENLVPDVALFIEELGPRAYPALAVKMTAARELMLPDLLRAISDVTTTPVLTVREKGGAR